MYLETSGLFFVFPSQRHSLRQFRYPVWVDKLIQISLSRNKGHELHELVLYFKNVYCNFQVFLL